MRLLSTDPSSDASQSSTGTSSIGQISFASTIFIICNDDHITHAGSPTEASTPTSAAAPMAAAAGLKRSFRDIVGVELSSTMEALTSDTGRVSPLTSELESLLSRSSPLASTSRQGPTERKRSLVHEKYGFAALGGFVPSEEPEGAPAQGPALNQSLYQVEPRIHPFKTFLPGQVGFLNQHVSCKMKP